MDNFKEEVEIVEEEDNEPPEVFLPDPSPPTRAVSVGGGGGDEGKKTEGAISAPLGAMVQLVGKLDILLAPQGLSSRRVKDAIRLLKEDVEEIGSYLDELSEVEDPPPMAMCWMNEARDLSYEVQDFIRNSFEGPEDLSIVAKTTRALCKLTGHGKTIKRLVRTISEFRMHVKEAIKRHTVYGVAGSGPSSVNTLRRRYVSVGPMLPTQYEDTIDIVIDGRMNKFITSLAEDGDKQLKVVSVFGSACLGKTTLARVLYNTFGKQYNCRAFIWVSRKPDTKRIFRDMLSQLQGQNPPKDCKEIDLIDTINKYLQDKRYLIIIDDVWTASVWNIISHAFPKGGHGSRIITTTQIEDVALTCCHYHSDHAFEMKPLDEDHSRKLFFNRIFGSESHCPQQLKEILTAIVEICGGLPLATISIASLLASQPVITIGLLTYIYQSLSSCFSSNSTSERMRKVLNLSYNNLPHHLKTCLLYLTMYPEGSTVYKDDLVRQWMAEVFISTTEGQDIKEVVTSYLDELIGRRFIQPIHINYNNEVVSCAVHDAVHDLIAHKSAEQNFIVAIDYIQMNVALSRKVRRLSLLFGNARYAKTPANIRKIQVRSLTFFGLLECMPCITEFKLLCVLNLQLSDHGVDYGPLDLAGISELFHLRYLKIASNVSIILPKHGLQCLETLDITDARVAIKSGVPCVPYINLPHLLHLSLSDEINLVKWIGSLVSDDKIKYLQDLHITTPSRSASYDVELIMVTLALIISSGHQKLKTIVVRAGSSVKNAVVRGNDEPSIWNDVLLPPLLQRFEFVTPYCSIFSRIPPSVRKHGNLCILKIEVRELKMSCVDILRGLPALTALSLYVRTAPCERIMFDKTGFSVLKYFKLRFTSGIAWLTFEADAMPNLWKLKLVFDAISQMDQKLVLFSNRPLFNLHKCGTAVISIGHMPFLKEISVKFGDVAADVEYALMVSITNHPSNPTINKQPVDYSCYGDERSKLKQPGEILVEEPDEYDQKQPDKYHKQQPEGNLDEQPDEILVREQDEYDQKQPYEIMEEEPDEYYKQQPDDSLDEEPDEYHKHQPYKILDKEPDEYHKQQPDGNLDEESGEYYKTLERSGHTRISSLPESSPHLPVREPLLKIVDPLPQIKTVGLETKLRQLYNLFEEGDSNIIGVWGPGGVGKTTLLHVFNNSLNKQAHDYQVVIFIEVSNSETLHTKEIQQTISERLNLPWNDAESVAKRAKYLVQALARKKFVVLLDDVRKKFRLEDVGIPTPDTNSQSKLVFTSRYLEICFQMNAQKSFQIEMQTLDDDASWDLLVSRLGKEASAAVESLGSQNATREYAMAIAKSCGGLPLALNIIGTAVAGLEEREWKSAADAIATNINTFDGVDELFGQLKYSYDRLTTTEQQCFLYCTLFPEYGSISTEQLVDYWLAEGFLLNDREKGYLIIHSLISASLLQVSGSLSSKVKMHHVIRHLGLWLVSKSDTTFLCQPGMALHAAPSAGEWKEATRISIMSNNITELCFSPKCKNVTTLLIQKNPNLNKMSNIFFRTMSSLKVLDLSHTAITSLPECEALVALEHLNLSHTHIMRLPERLWLLKELRHLDLSVTVELEDTLKNFSQLHKLRVLNLFRSHCRIRDVDDLILDSLRELLFLGISIYAEDMLNKLNMPRPLAKSTHSLNLKYCGEMQSIKISDLNHMEHLEELYVESCYDLNTVVADAELTNSNLQFLTLSVLPSLENVLVAPMPHNFQYIRKLIISQCPKLLNISWVRRLQLLERLVISHCDEMIAIVEDEEQYGAGAQMKMQDDASGKQEDHAMVDNEWNYADFPKLRLIVLTELKKLRSISKPRAFPCLETLRVEECPNMRSIPLGSMHNYGKLKKICGSFGWWKELQWEKGVEHEHLESKYFIQI